MILQIYEFYELIFNSLFVHSKAVRGESIISGYLIRPHGEGCSLTYVSQSDPKGWIPVMVLNTLLTSQGPNMIEKLVGAATKYTEWYV